MPQRRGFIVVATAALAGCGFELQRSPALHLRSVYLSGFKNSSNVAEKLRVAIEATPTTQMADSPAQAQLVFVALVDGRERSVVATTSSGQVRELQLRTRLRYELRSASGRKLGEPVEILLKRDMSYNERTALAKEHEETLLFNVMENDIVGQVMRRLAAVSPPADAEPAPPASSTPPASSGASGAGARR